MKRDTIKRGFTGMLVILIALFASTFSAFAETVDDTVCHVRSTEGVMRASDGKLTLARALLYSNTRDTAYQYCSKLILLTLTGNDTIFVKDKLMIEAQGTAQYGSFMIAGDYNGEGKQVTLNASRFEGKAGECFIDIATTASHVTLKNIQILGVKDGVHAVCINGDNAVMDNVDIENVSGGGSAFVFGPNASNGEIMATSSVIGVDAPGYAVNFGVAQGAQEGDAGTGSGESQLDNVNMFANKIEPVTGGFKGEVNDEGLVIVPQATPDADGNIINNSILFSGVNPTNFFLGRSVTQICLQRQHVENNAKGVEMVRVTGFVKEVEGSLLDATGNVSDSVLTSTKKRSSSVARLQIYTNKGFYGYVGKMNRKLLGMGDNTQNSGVFRGMTGAFDFYLPQSIDGGLITLVPEASNGSIGTASTVLDIGIGNNDGPCVKEKKSSFGTDTPTPGFDEDGNPIPADGRIRFQSIKDCEFQRGVGDGGTMGLETTDPTQDTDGDGLYDDEEDIDRDCKCDRGLGDGHKYSSDMTDNPALLNQNIVETCWDRPDSDSDGIIDGQGGEVACQIRSRSDRSAITLIDSAICDPDGDKTPNAQDQDSDGDGRYDYQEDRNAVFSQREGDMPAVGLLYRVGTTDPIPGVENKGIVCPLGTTGQKVGVSYRWYTVTTDAAGVIKFADQGTDSLTVETNAAGPQEIYACKIRSLSSDLNFNGRFDAGNNETIAYSKFGDLEANDSDNDGLCDGSGTACKGKTLDNCPSAAQGTDLKDEQRAALQLKAGCPLVLPCIDGQSLLATDPEFVDYEGARPLKLADNDKSGVADLFERNANTTTGVPDYAFIDQKCGDYDDDGIPDCVEDPTGTSCSEPDSRLTKFNSKDSDNDGFIDGWKGGLKADVCPITIGTDDAVGAENSAESIDNSAKGCAKTFYKNLKWNIISCFLDRDNDTKRDCEEDLNRDGEYVPTIFPHSDAAKILSPVNISSEMLATVETDALKADSDDDGISDLKEKNDTVITREGKAMHTNPTVADTDGDGIIDGQEDANDDGTFKTDLMEGASVCIPKLDKYGKAIMIDTDPTNPDTDGDTLSDYQELNSTKEVVIGQDFLGLLGNFANFTSGVQGVSNPRCLDTDNDELNDNIEYNGDKIFFNNSNPMMDDSDGDGVKDGVPGEFDLQCALNPNGDCAMNMRKYADKCQNSDLPDSDRDCLPDYCEDKIGTDKYLFDSDGDNLGDGFEVSFDCTYDVGIDMDPRAGSGNDTDKDGISDDREVNSGICLNPIKPDSDGDRIPDGPMLVRGPNGQEYMSLGEDRNQDGKVDPGETSPCSSDTDGDLLWDGVGPNGLGEDMNYNGKRDVDAFGTWMETDPTLYDSNGDGLSDGAAMGGSMANLAVALNGQEGCSSSVTGNGTAPTSMYYLIGLLLMATKLAASRMRRRAKTPV